MNKLAAEIKFGPLRGFGSLGLEKDTTGEGALGIFIGFLSSVIGLLTIIAIIWFVFVLISGAISMMTAGDDKQAVENSKKRITTGLIGLVVVIASIFILSLVGYIFRIPLLDLNALFNQIIPK